MTATAVATSHRYEGFAIASLALAVSGFFLLPIIGSILGIAFGGTARRHIADDPTLEGESMARAGIIVGWVGLGLMVLFILFLILLATAFNNVTF